MTTTATFVWQRDGDLVYSFATPGRLEDNDWIVLINEIKNNPVTKYLGATRETEVSTVQRTLMRETFKTKRVKAAAVSGSALVRGIVTAVSWFGADIKSFTWADVRKALKYLQVTPEQEERACNTLTEWKRRFG